MECSFAYNLRFRVLRVNVFIRFGFCRRNLRNNFQKNTWFSSVIADLITIMVFTFSFSRNSLTFPAFLMFFCDPFLGPKTQIECTYHYKLIKLWNQGKNCMEITKILSFLQYSLMTDTFFEEKYVQKLLFLILFI